MTTALVVLPGAAFWLIFFSPRPPLMIDRLTLAGDGRATVMDRICTLPLDKKIPRKRGPRYKIL